MGKDLAYTLLNNQTSQELDYIYGLKQLSGLSYYSFCVSQYFWDLDEYMYILVYVYSPDFGQQENNCIFT